jgi:hypothetical protein
MRHTPETTTVAQTKPLNPMQKALVGLAATAICRIIWRSCELLGLPLADRPKFMAWARTIP